ncbi:MAG: ABC transporter permease, partial [Ignavibacteria bacterium]
MIEKKRPVIKTRIESHKNKWKLLDLKELVFYKDLFYYFILRDITVLYKQTILGLLWAIINPVFQMIVFSIIFGKLAQIASNGIPYPVFSFAAILPFNYFSQSLVGSSTSLISSTSLLTKVYFPRILIPLTPVFSKLVDFSIAFVILIGMM